MYSSRYLKVNKSRKDLLLRTDSDLPSVKEG